MKRHLFLILGFGLMLSGLSYMTSVSLAVPDTWTKKASMPTARRGLSTSVVNDKIYAIGGKSGKALSTVEVYDWATEKWAKKAGMLTARAGISTSTVRGKIYAIGGWFWNQHTGTVEEYDPTTDKWVKKADMSTARWGLSTSVVNGKIYAIGGSVSKDGALGTDVSTVEEYDPATNKWTKKADMPTARVGLSTSVVNGKIYAFGGVRGPSTAEEYDPVTDTWTKKADMPTGRIFLATSSVGGKIYAIGGNLGASTVVLC